MVDIKQNVQNVLQRIEEAARRTGRMGEEITLVAVTKTVEPERILKAIEAGVRHIGENRVQEAMQKIEIIGRKVTWHMVGHLQTNKAKHAVKIFDMIQSIDSEHLAVEVNKRCEQIKRQMPVLIEVNTSGEPTKYGCAPEDAIELLKKVARLQNLKIKGFMTIGRLSENPEEVRPGFRLLKNIYDKARSLNIPNTEINILSMGMSGDFELAIEEGSNMVRIGTAIFGPRPS